MSEAASEPKSEDSKKEPQDEVGPLPGTPSKGTQARKERLIAAAILGSAFIASMLMSKQSGDAARDQSAIEED